MGPQGKGRVLPARPLRPQPGWSALPSPWVLEQGHLSLTAPAAPAGTTQGLG